MAEQQTVEDLGKLVKSKYPDAYDKMSDSEVGTAVKSKYPDAYSNFSDKPKELTGTEKTRNLLVTGTSSGLGHYSPEGRGTFEFPKALNVAGAVAAPLELGAGLMSNPGGVLNLVKSAYSGVKEGLPKVLGGAALTGAGAGAEIATEGMTHLPSYARYVASYPGIRMMGQGLKEGARAFGQEFSPANMGKLITSPSTEIEPFTGKVSPVNTEAIKTKGPSLNMLSEAVKSGHMSMDQFEQELGKLGYDPATQGIIRNNLTGKLAQKSPVVPGESPKSLNLGHLKSAVKAGLMDLEQYDQALAKAGYSTEDRGILRSLLEKSMKEDEEADAAAKIGKSVKGEVKSPEKSSGLPPQSVPEQSQQARESIFLGRTEPQSPIGEVKSPDPRMQKIQDQYKVLREELDRLAPGNAIGKVNPPGQEAQPLSQGLGEIRVQKGLEGSYKEPGEKLPEKAIEEAQGVSRGAKENRLAQHLAQNVPDFENLKPTLEMRKALRKEAGLDYIPSERTFNEAIRKAKLIKPESFGQQ